MCQSRAAWGSAHWRRLPKNVRLLHQRARGGLTERRSGGLCDCRSYLPQIPLRTLDYPLVPLHVQEPDAHFYVSQCQVGPD